MSFSPGVIVLWTGTNASIPAGWTRETSLDGKYPKARGVEAVNTTGGNANHTHTSPAHTHALNSHTHNYTSGARNGGGLNGGNPAGTGVIEADHTHPGTTGASVGGTTNSTAVTYGAVSNDPPYVDVIFIKPTSYTPLLPSSASILWDSATVPTGMGYHNGIAASPDLRNKYLKGAATSGDAGGTGGSYTNTHDISHTHTTNTHTHADANTGVSTDTTLNEAGTGALARNTHVHTASTGAGTQALNSYTTPLVTTETVEPSFRKLNVLKNVSGGNLVAKVGMIAMWLGTDGDIPIGWTLYSEQNDYYLKSTNSLGESGLTGGSNSHTHANQSHTHTSSGSHDHTVSFGTSNLNDNGVQPGALDGVRDGHTHDSVTSESTQASYASANTSANTSSNEPPYRTVSYIKLDFISAGALMLFL